MFTEKYKKNSGFTLIELLVAITTFTVLAVAIVGIMVSALRFHRQVFSRNEATYEVKGIMDSIQQNMGTLYQNTSFFCTGRSDHDQVAANGGSSDGKRCFYYEDSKTPFLSGLEYRMGTELTYSKGPICGKQIERAYGGLPETGVSAPAPFTAHTSITGAIEKYDYVEGIGFKNELGERFFYGYNRDQSGENKMNAWRFFTDALYPKSGGNYDKSYCPASFHDEKGGYRPITTLVNFQTKSYPDFVRFMSTSYDNPATVSYPRRHRTLIMFVKAYDRSRYNPLSDKSDTSQPIFMQMVVTPERLL